MRRAGCLCAGLVDATIETKTLTCVVPEGTGAANEVLVIRNGRESFALNASQHDKLLVGYLPPEIATVSPATLPTTGGVVTLTGRNFGPSAAFGPAEVWYGGEPVPLRAGATFDDGYLELVVAAGAGAARKLELVVDGQRAVALAGAGGAGAPWAYATADVGSIAPLALSTTGGTLVNITSADFGPAGVADFWLASRGGAALRPLHRGGARRRLADGGGALGVTRSRCSSRTTTRTRSCSCASARARAAAARHQRVGQRRDRRAQLLEPVLRSAEPYPLELPTARQRER